MALEIGQLVDNRYRIAQMLAQGGMGAIYRAWDTRLERPIALKEMMPQPGLDKEMLEQLRLQFENEARVLGTLSHPNLVRVTDYFSWEDNVYLVMDFVEGESLADRIARQGAQPASDVVRWAAQLLDALSYCHKRGILHRDIKPQNIIITTEDKAVMVDFGLVKLWNPEDPETRTVMRGAGTPEYAPPEQYDMGVGHTDPRSDIYSLGATLYQALTGQSPPTATQRMANPASFVPPRKVNAAIDPAVEAAILKAMEVAMDRRFQDAKEMEQEMLALAKSAAPVTRPATPRRTVLLPETDSDVPMPTRPPTAAKPKRRGVAGLLVGVPLVVIILCVVGIVASIVILALIGMSGDEDPTPTPTQPRATATTPYSSPTPRPPTPVPPTSTPDPSISSPVIPGEVLFEDDFSDPSTGWEEWEAADGSVTEYGDGFFRITGITPGWMWAVSNRSYTDVVIDVDATQIAAPSNNNDGYGVMCRVQADSDGYLLAISGDGLYSIFSIVDGAFNALAEWTSTDVVNQGNATNHVQAICNGSYLALVVNGEVLAEVEDNTFSDGDVALSANTYEEEETVVEIHFENLVVSAPDTGLLFWDDFSDPESGWNEGEYENGSHGYVDEVYYVSVINEDWMVWGVHDVVLTEIIIDVDATVVESPEANNNAYGIMCRLQDNDDGYYLRISGDGYYRIDIREDGESSGLVDWQSSDVINQGLDTNHITAICSGTRLALIVNGELLAEVEDSTFTEGYIGLTAATYEQETTTIHFDDLVVQEARD